MYCIFCFSFYSVFWRMSTWVSQSTSVSKRWALTVSIQTMSTPCTGLQSEQTATDSQCPDYSKLNGGIGQWVSIVILDTPVVCMFKCYCIKFITVIMFYYFVSVSVGLQQLLCENLHWQWPTFEWWVVCILSCVLFCYVCETTHFR